MRADDPRFIERVESATGRPPKRVLPLAGGCIAEVLKVELDGGGTVVAKLAEGADATAGGLTEEGRMLTDLRRLSDLPLPEVLFVADDLLLLEFVESSGRLDAGTETHAADLLAALHGIEGRAFGYERDTLIGPLRQPNPWSESWIAFFAEQRLLYMGRLAAEAGQLSNESLTGLESLCARLTRYLEEPRAPALIHGDLWDGNILVRDGRIAAVLDPAIYYADPEIELAFTTLFGTFGQAFFDRYQERRPIAPGFFEVRRDLYNLYPLLVHTRLFGGHYAASVGQFLRRYA